MYDLSLDSLPHLSHRFLALGKSLTALLFATMLAQHPLHAQELVSSITTASASVSAPSYSSSAADLLPEAPQPQDNRQAAQSYEHQDGQTNRILGIIPNFRAVSTSEHLPPQSVKDKFVDASEDSFDYSSIALPAAVALYDYERNATPEFGSGGVGYGRYLWHSLVDQTVENYMVEFVVPTVTHEDTRYYTLGHGGFAKRAGYSLSRIFVTRSDSGKETFNIGEVGGAALGASISNAYYPSAERTVGNTVSQMGTNIGIDALGFMLKEFWPDINHYLFHGEKPYNDSSPTPSPAKQ